MITALVSALLMAPAPQHWKIDGDGFFRVARGQAPVYAREIDVTTVDGVLRTTDGALVLPRISGISGEMTVSLDGTVSSHGVAAGRIVLASFADDVKLHKEGNFLTCSMRATLGSPGDGLFGVIRSVSAATARSTAKTAAPAITPTSRNLIQIAANSEVEGDSILLGDVADIAVDPALAERYKAVDLGAPPIFGARRGLSAVYILAKIRNQGLNGDNLTILCPPGASVVRKGQTVTADSMLLAALEAAKTVMPSNLPLKPTQKIFEARVAPGNLVIEPGDTAKVGEGVSVNLILTVNGTAVGYRQILLVPSPDAIRTKAGDPIKLRILRGGATVEVSGKVQTGGLLGSVISIQTETGALFSAIFKSAGLAEVRL